MTATIQQRNRRPVTAMMLALFVAAMGTSGMLLPFAAAFQVQPNAGALQRTILRASTKTSNNGGGIATIPAGNRALFDPDQQGKLAGTHDLDARLAQGTEYNFLKAQRSNSAISTSSPQQQYYNGGTAPATTSTVTAPPPGTEIMPAQHYLEDIGLPLNYAKPKDPVTATVLDRYRLITNDAPGDIEHVVLQLPPDMHYVEGQSLSVIPPGTDVNGKPHKPRLYSIASTRYGDYYVDHPHLSTVSLCVRRAEYVDPVTALVDPSKPGVCSTFLCNVQPGDTVQVAGPVGKTMLLPDQSRDIICVATGTGIAPFRAFLRRLFWEHTVARHQFMHKAWLILGVPVTGGILYADEFAQMQRNNVNDNAAAELEITYAISREMRNASGGKLYVQDVLTQRADELFDRMHHGAVIYFCGLKGMMPGILDALAQVATARGLDWNATLKTWQANHQWHVEVY